MHNLLKKEIINKNIKILKELTVGQKLYVNHETLELSVDDRSFQGLRRKENRYECLIPILLTLWGTQHGDLLNNIKETYNNNFLQLDHMEKIINYTFNKKSKKSKENVYKTRRVTENEEKVKILENTIQELKENNIKIDSEKTMLIIDYEKKIKNLEKIIKTSNKDNLKLPGDGYKSVFPYL